MNQLRPVVLGELGEARVEAIGARDHSGGHAVDAPALRGAAQVLQHRVDSGGEAGAPHALTCKQVDMGAFSARRGRNVPPQRLVHMKEPLLTADQIAQILGVPKSWVYEQLRKGRILTVNLGRCRRYRAEASSQWIEARKAADRTG